MHDDPRRWRLAGSNDWGGKLSSGSDGASVRVRADGVRLGSKHMALSPRGRGPADPSGSRASVGGLTVPRNVYARGGEVLVAASRRRRVLRWDAESGELRSWVGLESLGRGGRRAPALVLTRLGQLLIVAEKGRSRVVAIHPALPLVIDAVSLPGQRLLDLEATKDGAVLILAREPGGTAELWRWKPGADLPARSGRVPPAQRAPAINPTRLLADESGRLHVFDAAGSRLLALPADPQGPHWEAFNAVVDRFAPLSVVIEPDEHRGWRLRIPPLNAPVPHPWPSPAKWPAYDREGRPVRLEPDAPVGLPPYVATGVFEVGPLDGGVPRVVWDRIELDVSSLPVGTAIEVRTRTSDDNTTPDPAFVPWSAKHRITEFGGTGNEGRPDFAVLSSPGRYLWTELTLVGGAASPLIDSLTAVYPRKGIADFLPLVFRETDQDTRFLERFIGALERTWEPLERAVDDFDRELRPETASSAAMLDFLGSWFDEPMQPDWKIPARRNTVRHGGRFLFRRGTPEAVRAALELFLANRLGGTLESLGAIPFIWEHFRSRLPLHTAVEGQSGESIGRLFGSEVLQRLRLGSSAVGTGTLRDVGSPETDHVTLDAHRYSVFVPRALVPTAEALRGLHQVLVREQPVHAMAEVVLIDPRFRVGVQSTLGVDSLLGVYPTARLSAASEDGEAGIGTRLDYDSLLAGPESEPRQGVNRLDRDGGTLPWRIT